MRLPLFALLFFLIGLRALAQNHPATPYANQISQDELREYLSILASDALEGRETGKRGQKMAAAFIAAHFNDIGLAAPVNGSHFQPFTLYTNATPNVSLIVGKATLKSNEEFILLRAGNAPSLQAPLLFAGAGTEADLARVNVKGKAVMMIVEPGASLRNNKAAAKAFEMGASIVAMVFENTEDYLQLAEMMKQYAGSRMSLTSTGDTNPPLLAMNKAVVEKSMGMTLEALKKQFSEKKAPKNPPVLQWSVSKSSVEIKTENVLGFLEGTDKKDEIIVVTSHYDHIGKKSSGTGDLINNGADDDGSGTVTVMELAKIFSLAKKEGKGPRRSILFMTVVGEEKGLLGSEYYTMNPVFPLSQTMVDLNIDMVGRRDPQHKDSAPYVYVIGSDKLSMELHNLSEQTNKTNCQLLLDYTYNDQNHPDRLYYRSDHWNFAKNNIPIIFYFDGIHEDYHRPSDEVDKIEFDLLAKRAQLVFYTAWELANRDGKIKPDK